MVKNNFQRVDSKSNAHVGKEFEIRVKKLLEKQNIFVEENFPLEMSAGIFKGTHRFDLGSLKNKVIIECKNHKWTSGENSPSAKLSLWNEAMYFFSLTPKSFKKMLFVLNDYSPKHKKTLAEYYIGRYGYLVPSNTKIYEVKSNQFRELNLKSIIIKSKLNSIVKIAVKNVFSRSIKHAH